MKLIKSPWKLLALPVLCILLPACAPMAPVPTETSVPEPLPPPVVEEEKKPEPPPAPPEPPKETSSAVNSLLDRGWNFYRNDNFEAALSVAERAQRIDPRSAEVYLLMASARFSLYQVDVAEQLARRGLALAGSGTVVGNQLQSLLARISAGR
ncbi:MAG: hypothetical protein WC997_16260 [Porticoccaceae bacterium]